MKKHILFFSLFYSIVITGQVQTTTKTDFSYFDKNKNLVSLNFFGGLSRHSYTINLEVRYGKFWFSKFNMGMETGLDVLNSDDRAYWLGPFARYYFIKKKIAPFAEVNYTYEVAKESSQNLSNYWRSYYHNIFSGGGVALTGILNHFGLEIFGGYLHTFGLVKGHPLNGDYHFNQDNFHYGLRFTIHF